MRTILYTLYLIFAFKPLLAQNYLPILDRKVTVKVVDQTLGKVLNIISETADFNFSYNNSIINVNKIVSIHAENRRVEDILDQLFKNDLNYQQIGKHLVLQKKPIVRQRKQNIETTRKIGKYNYLVSGYIRDMYNGDGISQVSIYEKSSLQSEISGDFGYYKIQVSSRDTAIVLRYSRASYRDTVIRLHYQASGISNINLNMVSMNPQINIFDDSLIFQSIIDADSIKTDTLKKVLVWQDSSNRKFRVVDTKLGAWLISNYQKLNDKNIRDTFERDWQFTFIPPLGSNGDLSGFVTNKFSINFLAGYNGGLNGAEFGGFVNIIKNDMRGAQFSGFGNIVGGNTNGGQFAGFFNHNLSDVDAFQAAGFYNYNHLNANGVQLAGFANINRRNLNGVQGSGFFNYAQNIDGGQVSGFINIAHKVRGFQIGIINVADTLEGVAIGILNFIRNGLHQIELSLNESDQYGFAYKSGTGRFYSNVLMSIQLPREDSASMVTYGFGIGSNKRLSDVFRLSSGFSVQQMTLDFNSNHLNLQNRLNGGIEIKLFKGFAVFGDLTLNHMINDSRNPKYESRFKTFGGKSIWESTGRFTQKIWTGFQFGLRIL